MIDTNPPKLVKGNGPGLGRFRPHVWEGNPDNIYTKVDPAPRAINSGPIQFSTNVGLEKWPTVVWDVNHYYAELEIHWSASNKEIREAYQRLDGQSSSRLTYIVKQLLDPEIRRGYDATQFGSVFFDRYIAEYVKAEMMRDSVAENGRMLTYDEQVEQGNETIDLSKFINKSVGRDWSDDVEKDNRWKWGYYLLNTEIYDTEKLRIWQQSLIKELSQRDIIMDLSVGLKSGLSDVRVIQSKVVAFLGLDDEDYLDEIVQQIINTTNNKI